MKISFKISRFNFISNRLENFEVKFPLSRTHFQTRSRGRVKILREQERAQFPRTFPLALALIYPLAGKFPL